MAMPSNPAAIKYLIARLQNYGVAAEPTAEATRTEILGLCAAMCVAGRVPGDKKLHTFASLWSEAWGESFETRERAARRREQQEKRA
jgi:hypothetical protein